MPEQNQISIFSLQSGAQRAGAELRTHSILSRLNRDTFHVTVCFLSSEGPVSVMYRDSGIETIHLGNIPFYRAAWKLWLILQKKHFDIVEIYGLRINIIGRLICRLTGNRTVVAMQRSVDDWRKIWHVWLDRITSRWVTLYLSNTHAAVVRFQERERIPAEKMRVIQNGIDPTLYAHVQKGTLRQQTATPPETTVIVCVGNLRKVKGHLFLLQAMALLKKQYSNFKVWLVGEGPIRAEIDALVQTLSLQNHVLLLGQRTDIPAVLSDADIFVLTSLWEGMPGSLMEAMAAGLPSVASSVGGIPELILHDETGFLVPPRNPQELAQKILLLCTNVALRKKMGCAARERIKNAFLLQDKVTEYEKFYKSLYAADSDISSTHNSQ